METTLNKIREHSPCTDGWEKLLKSLGKTKADDELIGLLAILESNGLDDALWCLRAVDGHEKAARKLACDFALSVTHLWVMPEIVGQYLATQDETIRAAARAAAWAAAGAAARDAARAAARAAAGDAAWAAARAAAGAAAGDAARDAARAVQKELFIKMCEENQ